MNEGVCLVIEVDPIRIGRRIETGYCDEVAESLDAAIARAKDAADRNEAVSIALLGNAAEVLPELLKAGFSTRCRYRSNVGARRLNGYMIPRYRSKMPKCCDRAIPLSTPGARWTRWAACRGDARVSASRRDRI